MSRVKSKVGVYHQRPDGEDDPWPMVYDDAALQRIASAIDVPESMVIAERQTFENAAGCYRGDRRGLLPDTTRMLLSQPSVLKRELDKLIGVLNRLIKHLDRRPLKIDPIRNAAISVLKKRLGIVDPDLAADGPGDEALRYVLSMASSAPGDPEELLCEDCGLLARAAMAPSVSSISEDMDSIREAAFRIATDARSAKVWLDEISVLRNQREGDADIQSWLVAMDIIHNMLTGNNLTTSWNPMTEANDAGYFDLEQAPCLLFLMAASKPLGINLSPAAWNRRISDLRH